MEHEKIKSLSDEWLKAWNQRDLNKLISMIAPDSRFEQMESTFAPIFVHGQALVPGLYLKERFRINLATLDEKKIYFDDPYFFILGDTFFTQKFKTTTGCYVKETISLNENGQIDQIYRQFDLIDFPN